MDNHDIFKKTLRWIEPFGGWGQAHNYFNNFNVSLSNNDTGLCNRIFHWEIAHFLSEINKNSHKIQIQQKHWPELPLFDMPNTFPSVSNLQKQDWTWNFDYETLSFKTVYDLPNENVYLSEKLKLSNVAKIFNNNGILDKDHYHSNFGYETLKDIINKYASKSIKDSYDPYNRPLTKIRLRHSYMEETLSSSLHDCVGIHIRRFNGVKVNDEEIKTWDNIDSNLGKMYKEKIHGLKSVNDNYTFYPDKIYFDIIDEILKINPKQKFYISHDLPDVFLRPYELRYKDRISEKVFFRYAMEENAYRAGMDIEFMKTYGNVFANVIDLFGLSYCGMLIANPDSTWSEFAKYYNNEDRNKPVVNVRDNNIEQIIEVYKNSKLNNDTTPYI